MDNRAGRHFAESSARTNRPDGTALAAEIFNEVTLRNVYDGVDLRLYSADKGDSGIRLDRGPRQDYSQIRIAATGQDGIVFTTTARRASTCATRT